MAIKPELAAVVLMERLSDVSLAVLNNALSMETFPDANHVYYDSAVLAGWIDDKGVAAREVVEALETLVPREVLRRFPGRRKEMI